jgi:aminopeptidase N
MVRDYSLRFRYRNIMTEELVKFFNEQSGADLTPIFDQYLRQAALPVLELRFQDNDGKIAYRWKTEVKGFAMPVRVGRRTDWELIKPTTEWKTMKSRLKKEEFEVATDRYYIEVNKTSDL